MYACLTGLSVGLNEAGLDEIQAFLFYLWVPMLLVVSMLVLHPTDRSIRRTLVALLVAGLILSAYVTVLHIRIWSGEDITVLYRYASSSDPIFLARKGVPGVGSNMFPSMLVPIVLTGLYFLQQGTRRIQLAAGGATAFLFFTLLITSSRGAMVSLAAALFYLALRRWFRVNTRMVLIGALVLVVSWAFGDRVTSRFSDSVFVRGFESGSTGYDDRLMVSLDSLSFYFVNHPIAGAGFTYFRESQGPRIAGTDHNLYTQLLASGGVLVAVPFLLILFVIYRNAAGMLRRCSHD